MSCKKCEAHKDCIDAFLPHAYKCNAYNNEQTHEKHTETHGVRLIDSNALCFEIVKSGASIDFINKVTEFIKDAPTIESKTKVIAQITFDEEKLREIVKEAVERFKEEYEIIDKPLGEWIINWDDRYRKCTNCNKIWWFDYGSYDSDYCPNCGARMKGVDDEINCR